MRRTDDRRGTAYNPLGQFGAALSFGTADQQMPDSEEHDAHLVVVFLAKHG